MDEMLSSISKETGSPACIWITLIKPSGTSRISLKNSVCFSFRRKSPSGRDWWWGIVRVPIFWSGLFCLYWLQRHDRCKWKTVQTTIINRLHKLEKLLISRIELLNVIFSPWLLFVVMEIMYVGNGKSDSFDKFSPFFAKWPTLNLRSAKKVKIIHLSKNFSTNRHFVEGFWAVLMDMRWYTRGCGG